MEINKYGVLLTKLTLDKIELVRQKRNCPEIQQYMEYRSEITPEMQLKWFQKINSSEDNYYFIVNYQGVDVGLINLKDIDYTQKSAESGIFIWDINYRHKGVSYRASLCQRDFAFEVLGLNIVYAHILKDNPRSIKYNEKFGFVLAENQEDKYNQLYYLTKESYLKNRDNIINIINTLS